MTESRPPASRGEDARSADRAGVNPLERPLPPGLGRRPTTHAAPEPAAGPAPRRRPAVRDAFAGPGAAPAAAAAPSAPGHEARPSRPTAAPRTAPPRAAAASAGAARVGRSGAEIPLMAPPAWQLAEMRAEEEQASRPLDAAAQRGLPAWAGLLVLLAITGVGGLIDAIAGAGIKGAFSIGLVLGSLVAILLVRRSAMFPVVVAPPLVYFVASAALLYVRSGGFSDKGAITDVAASWLVYGFPAIAGATALVLIVAGVRLILHR